MRSPSSMVASVIAAVGVTACAGVRLEAYERHTAEIPRDVRAAKLFEAAKKCWSEPEKVWKSGVTVDTALTLEGAVVSVRYYSDRMIEEMKPFFQFRIRGDDKSSTVEVLDWTGTYLGKKNYRSDASRWLGGDWSCGRSDS